MLLNIGKDHRQKLCSRGLPEGLAGMAEKAAWQPTS
jgi:hypothetical protein